MKKKNLLLLVANLGIGGQQRVAIRTAAILQEDYNITLAIFNKQEDNYDFKGNLVNFQLPPKQGVSKLINLIRRIRALKKLKRECKIEIAISFGTTANIPNALSKMSDKVLVSVRGYGSLSDSVSSKIIGKLIYGQADVVVTVAQKLSSALEELYSIPKAKIKTIYNPYNLAEITANAALPVSLSITSPTIVSVGRMNKVKGYRHLIGAVPYILKVIPDLKLLLVGDGDEVIALQEKAEGLGIRDCLTFAGFQSNPDSYVAKCDLYVLTSISEGFPNALIEAMACGLPVVATDCKTGPREILTKSFEDQKAQTIEYTDYGVLVPPFTSDESDEPDKEKLLAQAIIEMLTNRERNQFYKQKAIERAAVFSFETYRENLLKIIEEP
ncbi:MAG: glycosyltransferase [Desulfosporosinus sp.]|nr:glycosyltransferase [Desulfosporosinus sp.]